MAEEQTDGKSFVTFEPSHIYIYMYIYPLSVSTSICSTNKRKMLWVPSHREHNGHNEHIIRYLPLLGLFTGIILSYLFCQYGETNTK